VAVTEIDVTADENARDQMQREYGHVATPTIVVGRQIFWGFEENKGDIAGILGLPSAPPPAPPML